MLISSDHKIQIQKCNYSRNALNYRKCKMSVHFNPSLTVSHGYIVNATVIDAVTGLELQHVFCCNTICCFH